MWQPGRYAYPFGAKSRPDKLVCREIALHNVLESGWWEGQRTLKHVLEALLHQLVCAADQRQAVDVIELRRHLGQPEQPVSQVADKAVYFSL